MIRPRNLEVELNVDQTRLLYLSAHAVCFKLQCSLHDTLGDLHDAGHSPDRGGLGVHAPAFLHLLGRESWRSPVPSALSLGPLQACLYPFAGGLHLVGPLGQHHPAEELGRGAVVVSVDALSDGHDTDVLPGEFRLDLHSLVEVAAEPVQPGDHDGVIGPNSRYQLAPGGTGHGAGGHFVREDMLPPDSELLQDVKLRLQVPGRVVGLADPGVAVGYGDHQVNLA